MCSRELISYDKVARHVVCATASLVVSLFAQLLSDVVKSRRRAAADQIPSTTTIRLSIPITVRKVDKVELFI